MMRKNEGAAFTLVEILLTTSIAAVIGSGLLVLINPQKQIQKAWDVQKKRDLATFQKIFEDFYNDKEAYPMDTDVCNASSVDDNGTCTCQICGLSGTADFSPYLSKLYCDPEHPRKDYVYKYDCGDIDPQWFMVCARLSTGPYGVSSPNIDSSSCYAGFVPSPTPTIYLTPTPAICTPDPSDKFCLKGGSCNNCGTFANCNLPAACDSSQLYSDANCTSACY